MTILPPTETVRSKPTHDQIAALAYDLWEKSGRLPKHDLAFWFEAERSLKEQRRKPVTSRGEGSLAQ